MALERLGAQVCDAVALQVLGPGEGLPTALLRANETTVVVVFPDGDTRGERELSITESGS